jgi:hypothetical protein
MAAIMKSFTEKFQAFDQRMAKYQMCINLFAAVADWLSATME